MATVRDPHELLITFFARETRQVWARHRASGQPVYIAPGSADLVRARAKLEWACIMPDCDVPISIRGGSVRDHYFHLNGREHTGESASHQAAKAMLAQWASERTHGRAAVVEEQTVKNRDIEVHRRPDVLVTRLSDGHRLALEVEYKSFSEKDWQAKQKDFDQEGIASTWVLGHTGIKIDTDLAKYSSGTPVTVPPLAKALIRSGRHVVIVNPFTQQIGTLAGDPALTTRPGEGWANAYLAVEELADCILDPIHGLVTSTMERIDAAEAERAREAAAQRVREEAERRRRQALQDRWSGILQANTDRWDASPLKERLLDRWGEVPAILNRESRYPHGIHAAPPHWHSALYEAHIHQRPHGHVFAIADCWTSLKQQGIDVNWDRRKRFRSLINFLEDLAEHRLIEKTDHQRWRVLADLDVAAERSRAARAEEEAKTQQYQKRLKLLHEEAELAKLLDAERREHYRQHLAALEHSWLASDIYRQIVVRYSCVPKCITWPNRDGVDVFDAAPELWRAHICVELIQRAQVGEEITANDAYAVLRDASVQMLDATQAIAAITTYLTNLRQRGILAHPQGNTDRFVATGADLS